MGTRRPRRGHPEGRSAWGPIPSLRGIAVQFLVFPKPSELAHFLISYIGFSLHNPTHTMSHGCIPRTTDAPFGRWLIVFSLLLDRPLSPIFSVPSCLTLEDHLVFMFPCFPPSSPYFKYANCGYIEGSGEVTTYRLSPVLRLCVGGHQLCRNSSRLRYSDPNPRGQSRACFGNKFYVNTGTPIMGTLWLLFTLQRQKPCGQQNPQYLLSGPLHKDSLALTIDSFHWLHHGPWQGWPSLDLQVPSI